MEWQASPFRINGAQMTGTESRSWRHRQENAFRNNQKTSTAGQSGRCL
jgi:hypothetical protein